MGERAWRVPKDKFAAAWNSAGSLADAVERVKHIASGDVPWWAVMVRATGLRKQGVGLKELRPAA
jgi:hypothetical protein